MPCRRRFATVSICSANVVSNFDGANLVQSVVISEIDFGSVCQAV